MAVQNCEMNACHRYDDLLSTCSHLFFTIATIVVYWLPLLLRNVLWNGKRFSGHENGIAMRRHVPSQRLDVDILASAVDDDQMVPAVHRMLEQVQGRVDAFRARRLDVEMFARPSHRIRRLVVFVEHQQSFNGRIRWDEVRELSIIKFLRQARKETETKKVEVSWRNFSHQSEINLIGRRIVSPIHTDHKYRLEYETLLIKRRLSPI